MNKQYQVFQQDGFENKPTLDEILQDAYALCVDTKNSAPDQNGKIEEMEL